MENKEGALSALSMWQPYASLLFAWDRSRGGFAKAFETRGFRLPPRLVNQPVAIHATQRFAPDSAITKGLDELCYDMFGCVYNFSLPRGAIIGIVRFGPSVIADTLRHTQPPSELAAGDWSQGRHVWPVLSAELLAKPIPAKGKQGWWRYPAQAIEARSGETGTGSTEGESAVATPCAPNQSAGGTDA